MVLQKLGVITEAQNLFVVFVRLVQKVQFTVVGDDDSGFREAAIAARERWLSKSAFENSAFVGKCGQCVFYCLGSA